MRPLAWILPVFVVGPALVGGRAHATVMQPSGEVMPVATPAAEISVVTSRGFPADADTLAGLFKYHAVGGVVGADKMMDPVRDANTLPGTFSPQCGLTGTIVVRGGGCKNELGWYNATEPAMKPTDAQIYTLVPSNLQAAPPNGLSCMDNDFCPMATMMTTQAPQHSWVEYDFAQNIRTSPNYKGGLIGLAMKGLAGSICTQTKYSQAELNDKNAAGAPWISVLIYQSVADPQAYYIAFEDQPTCAQSWRGCTGNQPNTPGNGNDGDFNDFVFYVTGLSCKTAGQPCTVLNAMGVCAGGVTECAAGGSGQICRQTVKPATEVCDAVDNDCNGMVDDGDNLCPTGLVCSQGVCRHPCDDSEFPCAPGQSCDTDGLCKDKGCIGHAACGAEQVCRNGVCVGGCDGVTCPHGQRCIRGNCVAPCAGVTCKDGEVCEGGACQPRCDNKCRSCATGLTCDMAASSPTVGSCVETGCENKSCPAGQVCVAGTCKDACDGVTCPGGQECMMGTCTPVAAPDAGTSGSGGGGGFSILGTGGQNGSGSGGFVIVGTAGNNGTGGGAGTVPQRGNISSCSCDMARGPGAGGVALMLVGLAMARIRKRRQSRAHARSSR